MGVSRVGKATFVRRLSEDAALRGQFAVGEDFRTLDTKFSRPAAADLARHASQVVIKWQFVANDLMGELLRLEPGAGHVIVWLRREFDGSWVTDEDARIRALLVTWRESYQVIEVKADDSEYRVLAPTAS